MSSINVLTINGEPDSEEELVEIIENAKKFFPLEIWDKVQYLGKLELKYDVKVATAEESYGAFLFERLIERVKALRGSDKLTSLLIGITPDPIIGLYYFFNGNNFKKAFYLVHDYVAEKTGVVSLFKVESESSSKVVAHGLGHNRGLPHHVQPTDLMHPELLRLPTLQVDGFCYTCLRKLARDCREAAD